MEKNLTNNETYKPSPTSLFRNGQASLYPSHLFDVFKKKLPKRNTFSST